MNTSNRIKILSLFLGDIIALYASLFATLVLRYGSDFYNQFTDFHAAPFTIIFAIWLAVFYVSGLYDLRRLRNNLDFIKTLALAIFINGLIATAFFYFLPISGIAPKTNLFITIAVFVCIEIFWRRIFNKLASSSEAPNRVLLVGNSKTAEEISKIISTNPQFGYKIISRLSEEKASGTSSMSAIVAEYKINVVVVPRHLRHDSKFSGELYNLLSTGIEIHDLANFYELVIRKVPLAEVDEAWFLEHLINHVRFYDQLKRASEVLCAIFLQIIALPFEILIALAIKIASPGPVVYKQIRIGKNNKEFTLYKFRTMRTDAERNGAQWSGTEDNRIAPFGKFLRHTHFDELPQLINIIKGDLSFVGPRPERPEFVKVLEDKIAYYEIRHLVHPGVTGWAQINYRYGSSVEDAYEKLQHDIYYIKNRSIILDLAIIIKTVKSIFINS